MNYDPSESSTSDETCSECSDLTNITSLSNIVGFEGNSSFTLSGNMWTDNMCLEYFETSLTCV